MFNEGSFPLIKLQDRLQEILEPNGWDAICRARIAAPKVSGYTKKVIDLALYQATGTDGQTRNMGVAIAWGGKTTTTFGQEPIVSYMSKLGLLKRVAGATVNDPVRYYTELNPIIDDYVKVYFNDVEFTDKTKYTVNQTEGYIEFTAANAPDASAVARATYGLSDEAPERVVSMNVFTFEDVLFESYVVDESLLLQSGSTYRFSSVASDATKKLHIKPGALVVKNGSDVIPDAAVSIVYLLDGGNPTVYNRDLHIDTTLYTTALGTLTVSYAKLYDHTGSDFGILAGNDFQPNSNLSIMQRVYETFRYVAPSFPTTLTFIEQLNAAWGIDCELYYWGNITKNRMMMFFRLDPAPDPPKCFYVPLYFGRLTTLGKAPKLNTVVIGGATTATAIGTGAVLTVNGKQLDYGSNVSNGLNGIQLQQTIGGSSFQKHYLAFTTHDAAADISPESRFNPSVYSNKYHISPIYVVHADDGYVGMLDEVYAVHPRNISQMDELEVRETASNEYMGEWGSNLNRTYHLRHTPDPTKTLALKIGCADIPATSFDLTEDVLPGDAEAQLKAVTFNATIDGLTVQPEVGDLIYGTYEYNQTYVFTCPTTPITPFLNSDVCPYTPIGLAILKKNKIDA